MFADCIHLPSFFILSSDNDNKDYKALTQNANAL